MLPAARVDVEEVRPVIGWLRGAAWLPQAVRAVAVGGYLLVVSWLTHRLATTLSRRLGRSRKWDEREIGTSEKQSGVGL